MRTQAGFSLIETLAALAVIAIVSGVAIAAAPAHRMSLNVEGDRLIRFLEDARDLALVRSRTVTVELSDSGYAATLHSRLSPVREEAMQEWEEGTSPSMAELGLPYVVVFDPVGLTEPSTITLYRRSELLRIAIDASGQVRRIDDDR